MSRALAAYLFYQRNRDDPNAELSRQQQAECEREGAQFATAIEALLQGLRGATLTEEQQVQTLFYDVGKAHYGESKQQLLAWFSSLYLLLFEKPHGPRWGQFVFLLGQERFVQRLASRAQDPFGLTS